MKLQINIDKNILARSAYCESGGKAKMTMVGQKCAVACAIVDLFGKRSWVGQFEIFIFEDLPVFDEYCIKTEHSIYKISLPREAVQFITNFDSLEPEERMKMDELSFDIEVPDELINEIGIEQVKEILSQTPYLEEVR